MRGGGCHAFKNRAFNPTVFFSIFSDQNRLRNEFVKQFTSKLRAFLFRGNRSPTSRVGSLYIKSDQIGNFYGLVQPRLYSINSHRGTSIGSPCALVFDDQRGGKKLAFRSKYNRRPGHDPGSDTIMLSRCYCFVLSPAVLCWVV